MQPATEQEGDLSYGKKLGLGTRTLVSWVISRRENEVRRLFGNKTTGTIILTCAVVPAAR